MGKYLSKCRMLKYLNLSGSGCQDMTDNCLKSMMEHTLEAKPQSSEAKPPKEGSGSILKRFNQLESIKIVNCGQITDVGLRYLANNGMNLKSVEIYDARMTSKIIEDFINLCPKLETLNLSHCNFSAEVPYELIDSSTKNFQSQLKHLGIGFCNMSDETLKFVASRCPNLESIELCYREKLTVVTDFGILHLATSCKNLKKINFGGSLFTNISLLALALHCPLLEKLHIHGCDNFTDEIVNELTNRCRQLQELHISNCQSLTDKTIEFISQNCIALQELYIYECEKITHASNDLIRNSYLGEQLKSFYFTTNSKNKQL